RRGGGGPPCGARGRPGPRATPQAKGGPARGAVRPPPAGAAPGAPGRGGGGRGRLPPAATTRGSCARATASTSNRSVRPNDSSTDRASRNLVPQSEHPGTKGGGASDFY